MLCVFGHLGQWCRKAPLLWAIILRPVRRACAGAEPFDFDLVSVHMKAKAEGAKRRRMAGRVPEPYRLRWKHVASIESVNQSLAVECCRSS